VVVKVLHPDLSLARTSTGSGARSYRRAAQQAQIVPLLAAGEIDGI
jgi:hypothetical protein